MLLEPSIDGANRSDRMAGWVVYLERCSWNRSDVSLPRTCQDNTLYDLGDEIRGRVANRRQRVHGGRKGLAIAEIVCSSARAQTERNSMSCFGSAVLA